MKESNSPMTASTQTTLDPAAINGMDWNSLKPRFEALAAEELRPEGVDAWLLRWSDLLKAIHEAGAQAERAKSEDTASAGAEAAFLHYVEQIVPQTEVASQVLKTKLLAVPGYSPAPNDVQMMKRLRAIAPSAKKPGWPCPQSGFRCAPPWMPFI